MSGNGSSPEIEWTPIKVKLGDLSHWAENPVTLSKAQAQKLLRSKEKLGKMQTLAIGPQNGDGKHPLYDGHQRANVWGAAFGMGLEVWALQSSRLLTDEERHAVPIMLRTAAGSLDWDALEGWTDYPLGEWGLDEDVLAGMKDDIAALGNLLESETPEPADAEPQIDRAEELQEKWRVQLGEVFRLGEHFIICGDCREPDTWKRLLGAADVVRPRFILTDPPYGIKRDKGFEGFGGFGTPIARRQYSDDWDGERPTKATFDTIVAQADKSIIFGGNFFTDLLPLGSHWIVWDKQNTMPTFGDCELAWTNIKRNSVKRYTVIYNGLIGKEQERFHPTQKPVELFSQIMVDYSDIGDTWLDPFCGSGTTIVAAANNKRRGLGIELLPKYCAVICERMATAFPGIEIERID